MRANLRRKKTPKCKLWNSLGWGQYLWNVGYKRCKSPQIPISNAIVIPPPLILVTFFFLNQNLLSRGPWIFFFLLHAFNFFQNVSLKFLLCTLCTVWKLTSLVGTGCIIPWRRLACDASAIVHAVLGFYQLQSPALMFFFSMFILSWSWGSHAVSTRGELTWSRKRSMLCVQELRDSPLHGRCLCVGPKSTS